MVNAATAVPGDARPHGLGIAVVFDWALAAQLLTQAVAVPAGRLGQSGGAGIVAVRVIGAVVLAAAGEALRRGVPLMRVLQIVLTAALAVGGAIAAVMLIAGRGGHGLILSAAIEATYAPFIAVRLASPATARWFASARGRGCAPRLCGPGWVTVLVAWSLVWGVIVAWSQSL